MDTIEKRTYIESEDKLVVQTIYDPTPVIDYNKAQKAEGRRYIGSKGQQMMHVARIDLDHVKALRNMGYDLLSPDPEEVRRALRFIQAEQQAWMTVDGKVIADKKQVWA